jgi:hypothetical protein
MDFNRRAHSRDIAVEQFIIILRVPDVDLAGRAWRDDPLGGLARVALGGLDFEVPGENLDPGG